jgi:hypothetical protein
MANSRFYNPKQKGKNELDTRTLGRRIIRVHTTGGRGSFRGKIDVYAEISIKIAEYTHLHLLCV